MQVLGIERVDYISKAGQRIQGVKLHLGYEKENCEGFAVLSEFIKDGVECNVQVGDSVELFYSKFGKVASVVSLPSKEINF